MKSEFCLNELQNSFKNQSQNFLVSKIWTSETFPENCSVPFEKYMNTSEGLKEVLKNLCIHGFSFVSNSPKSTKNGTKIVAERIGPIFNYMEGELWELTSTQNSNVSDRSELNR